MKSAIQKNLVITFFFIGIFVVLILGVFLMSNKSDSKSSVNGENTTNSSTINSTTSSVDEYAYSNTTTTTSDQTNTSRTVSQSATISAMQKPQLTIDKSKKYTALMKTDAGDIELELYASSAPNTVNNFIYLSKNNFYNNVIFHRVIDGFMIQGGDPTGTGAGGPGYKFDDEPFDGEYTRGTIAMANAGKNTNGSQFFIMHKDTPLPKNYVIFGKVTKGIEVVDTIATAQTVQDGIENSKPVKPVKILSVSIAEQ